MELKVYGNYQEYKKALDRQMTEAAEGFVKLGYLFRMARDTDILKESGYGNVNEFAKAEYNLDKTVVSRFISINERFSEDGNPECLKEQYRGIGYAKLAIMLQLPEEINEEITPLYSKTEIQAIKCEVDEEKSVTDIEILMEGEKAEQEVLDSNLKKTIHQMGEDEPELYVQLHRAVMAAGVEALQDVLAPDGEKIYIVRLRGIGRKMLSLKTTENTVVLVDIRSNEKETYTWIELYECIKSIMDNAAEPEKSWEGMYRQTFPRKEKNAPVQQKEKALAPRKEKKVQVAKKQEVKKKEEKNNEPEEEKEESSAEIAGEPKGKDNCSEQREKSDHSGEPTGSSASDREEQSGFCTAEPGEQEKAGSAGTDEAVTEAEWELREQAEELAEAARMVFYGWAGQELPMEELLMAERNTKNLLEVINKLIRLKTEKKQLAGQMSIENMLGDSES